MYLLDVNVLVASHRSDHVHFGIARAWLDEMLDRDDDFSVPSTVWGSFLRLTTDSRVFPQPLTLDELFEFVSGVRSQPTCRDAEPGPRHLDLLSDLCREGGVSGSLIPDAILAAIALEHNCEIVTFDTDFARFPSVRFRLLTPRRC